MPEIVLTLKKAISVMNDPKDKDFAKIQILSKEIELGYELVYCDYSHKNLIPGKKLNDYELRGRKYELSCRENAILPF
ncbi:MAG: hypothetical protein RBQ91_02220 [Acholeplasma sp.]|nr:hypothetical protein [Acholeplasma sp.]